MQKSKVHICKLSLCYKHCKMEEREQQEIEMSKYAYCVLKEVFIFLLQ